MARDAFGWIGTVVGGRYVVDDVVGEGGFAIVYRGRHRDIGTRSRSSASRCQATSRRPRARS
jgi:hypothetical protein